MAMTFVIDSLVQFDIPAYLLELLLSFDERAKIVTLGYQPKNFFGRFKNHQVVASSINRWIQEPQDLKHRWWLAPSATSTIPFEKGDTLVVISTGMAHSIIPEQYRSEAYLYLFDWQKLEKNLWSSLFNPFVEKWRQDSLKSFKNVAIAHHDFKNKFEQSVFLGPTLSTADFFIPTDEIQASNHLVHTEALTQFEVELEE